MAAGLGERVADLILATKHAAVPTDADARLVVDIDLSILGSAEERFDRYERDVRREYRWVPGFIYRRKRAEAFRLTESEVAKLITNGFKSAFLPYREKKALIHAALMEMGYDGVLVGY